MTPEAFEVGTGDFEVSIWAKPQGNVVGYPVMLSSREAGVTKWFDLFALPDGTVKFDVWDDGCDLESTSPVIFGDTWNQITIAKSNSQGTLILNGQDVLSNGCNTDLASGGRVYIGASPTIQQSQWLGWLDFVELRKEGLSGQAHVNRRCAVESVANMGSGVPFDAGCLGD